MAVKHDGISAKWFLVYLSGGGSIWTRTPLSSPLPAANTWYTVELHWKKNDKVELWIDGALVDSVSGLSHSYDCEYTQFGAYKRGSSTTAITVYADDVVVADAYIGSGATLQNVTDSLSLTDAFFRGKDVFVADTFQTSDLAKGNKTLRLTDSLQLSTTPWVLKTLKTLDELGLSDVASTPLRILQSTDTVSLVEVVQGGAGGTKKTRLFLILGDLALAIDAA